MVRPKVHQHFGLFAIVGYHFYCRDKILADIDDDKRNWLNAPWIVAEFYFYRRIVEAFKYFETGYDMFAKQKQAITCFHCTFWR